MSADPNQPYNPQPIGHGYALFQIAKALQTATTAPDRKTRDRAGDRLQRWKTVLSNILTGSVNYGSRSPLHHTPVWATLEVVTGGFATGNLLAGGTLRNHEIQLARQLPATIPGGHERTALNSYFLTDAGLSQLTTLLSTRRHDATLPEETALLTVAWLAENGHADAAWPIIDQIAPFFDRLRFYPIPLDSPRRPIGNQVSLQTVAQVRQSIDAIPPNNRILAQRESVTVWAPLHDRVVALFAETEADGWPCRHYPPDWAEKARTLLTTYAQLQSTHKLSRKLDRPNNHYFQLRQLLNKCALDPKALTGREVGRIKLILQRYREKRGNPGSPENLAARKKQIGHVSAPTYTEIAAAFLPRLDLYPPNEGITDLTPLLHPISQEEAVAAGIPGGTQLPEPVQRRLLRGLSAPIHELVHRGIVTSGDTLAVLLPELTAAFQSAGFADPNLQDLYSLTYRAFRRRRSLLLLNLEKQVQFEELPWIAAVEPLRSQTRQDQSKAALQQTAILALTSFPHAIIPNKLLTELKALAKSAALDIPLTEEVAADIFMGKFSPKFRHAALSAAATLRDSLYATYYQIDYPAITSFLEQTPELQDDPLAPLCAKRAGVALGSWKPAQNGMIIEQQQIITTQNLAALLSALGLAERLQADLPTMARHCFEWVCRQLQIKTADWHSRLIFTKNSAYAWRQMLFFLSLTSHQEVESFLLWATGHLNKQRPDFVARFRPALQALELAAANKPFDEDSSARRFLGWSNGTHWLLATGDKKIPPA